jgi:hypothetical protein
VIVHPRIFSCLELVISPSIPFQGLCFCSLGMYNHVLRKRLVPANF